MTPAAKDTLTETAGRLARRLEGSGLPDPGCEARELLREFLGLTLTQYYLKGEEGLAVNLAEELDNLVERRRKREPLAYLLGRKNFQGRDYLSDARALIPRPETELLVESGLGWLAAKNLKAPRILEIGTGTGCITVSLALEQPKGIFLATDVSIDALELARKNARRFHVTSRTEFLKSNVYEDISTDFKDHFDMILSNPPYVSTAVLSTLEPELSYEPRLALDGGGDGLQVIRRIVNGAPAFLKNGGGLFLEIGFDQGESARELLTKKGFQSVEIKKDFSGHDRVAKGEWVGSI